MHFRSGSTAPFPQCRCYVRSCPDNGHNAGMAARRKGPVPTANIIRVRVRTNSEADATRVWQAEARLATLPLDEDPLQTDLV